MSSSLALQTRTVCFFRSPGAHEICGLPQSGSALSHWVKVVGNDRAAGSSRPSRPWVSQDGGESLLPSPSAGPTGRFQTHIPIHAMTTTDATSSVGLVRKLMRRCLCNQAIVVLEKLLPDRFFVFLTKRLFHPKLGIIGGLSSPEGEGLEPSRP